MSKFTDVPPVVPLGNGEFRTTDELSFYIAIGESETFSIVVPKNFTTDFASIPWFCRWFIKPDSKYLIKASILHDHLYTGLVHDHNGDVYTRRQADLIFLHGMYICGAPKIKMLLAYSAVALFGGFSYGK